MLTVVLAAEAKKIMMNLKKKKMEVAVARLKERTMMRKNRHLLAMKISLTKGKKL